MEETQAIARLKRGDLKGLEVLVQRHYTTAVRAAFLVVQAQAAAEDVVQNEFVGLPRKIVSFDPSRPFGPWFLRSVVNAAINVARREARLVALETDADEDWLPEGWLANLPGPEESLEAAELRQTIWQALQQLSPNQRAAVVLRYYLELSEQEMADHLSRPRSSIKWWLHSARKRLRDLLRPLAFTQVQLSQTDFTPPIKDGD
jgi:RNA polymerase sigma-70 factor (ECF subfamily)